MILDIFVSAPCETVKKRWPKIGVQLDCTFKKFQYLLVQMTHRAEMERPEAKFEYIDAAKALSHVAQNEVTHFLQV